MIMPVLLNNTNLNQRWSLTEKARIEIATLASAAKRKASKLWKSGQQVRDRLYSTMQPHELDIFMDILDRISTTLSEAGVESKKRVSMK